MHDLNLKNKKKEHDLSRNHKFNLSSQLINFLAYPWLMKFVEENDA